MENHYNRINGKINHELALVCVTPMSDREFFETSPLAKSIGKFPKQLAPNILLYSNNNKNYNVRGLGELYNNAIENKYLDKFEMVAFVHDDVSILDWNISHHLKRGFCDFDILGIVGSSNVVPGQGGWAHDISLKDNMKVAKVKKVNYSGVCKHSLINGANACADYYGPPGYSCDILDGLFLATRVSTLRRTGLKFDSRFDFHCYDTDFCYSAKKLNLMLGTCHIAVEHECETKGYPLEWFENVYRLKEKWLGKDKSNWFANEDRYIFSEDKFDKEKDDTTLATLI